MRFLDYFNNSIVSYYDFIIAKKFKLTFILTLLIIAFFSTSIPDFKLDASADSLVLENDDDLKYYREINERYSNDDFVVITYKPKNQKVFDRKTFEEIDILANNLKKIDDVKSVVSILDVPLLDSPRISFSQLSENQRTLRSSDVNLEMANMEFITSPLYKDLLLSRDSTTTVMLVNFKRDKKYYSLLSKRDSLRQIRTSRDLSPDEQSSLRLAEKSFKDYSAVSAQRVKQNIKDIREIMEGHKSYASMFLGGVPMITSDMTDFIGQDIKAFGSGVLLFLILILGIIFRRFRWIFIPLFGCTLSVLFVSGFSGFMDWRITVISSNFPSLLLIITMAMTIHLAVRYRELIFKNPNKGKKEIILDTIHYMFVPCIYTSLTTIVAFVSLFVSGIRPVIDFGHMMTFGIVSAFIITFIIFPTTLFIMSKESIKTDDDTTKKITEFFAKFTNKHNNKIVLLSILLVVISIFGIINLKVENRFIDYFHSDTEIHQGMLEIDKKLGGTTPFDIILNPPRSYLDLSKEMKDSEDDDLFDELSDALGDEGKDKNTSYWLNNPKLLEITKIHDYLESLPEVGKVLSLSTIYKLGRGLNNNESLSDLQVGALQDAVSEDVSNVLIRPYLSEDGNQARITLRIIDSDEKLNRNSFIDKINKFLKNEMKYDESEFRTTNMLVLYNNMLQSLFDSQIQTIGFVFISILIMFIILFRSFFLAVIAIIPNMIPAILVLGFMGWKSIPLDLMTITIAAISVGIAVDNTIHYIIRFKREFPNSDSYKSAVTTCHGSIGKAIYYTSSIIVIGFSILALSNFIPTIYFGLLTGLAMLAALFSSLTLLPSLLIIFKPLGRK
tara:strand:+ start:2758 stop:5277 length:2520 start_codon:yes stop_codon:yes gene_type:complete